MLVSRWPNNLFLAKSSLPRFTIRLGFTAPVVIHFNGNQLIPLTFSSPTLKDSRIFLPSVGPTSHNVFPLLQHTSGYCFMLPLCPLDTWEHLCTFSGSLMHSLNLLIPGLQLQHFTDQLLPNPNGLPYSFSNPSTFPTSLKLSLTFLWVPPRYLTCI